MLRLWRARRVVLRAHPESGASDRNLYGPCDRLVIRGMTGRPINAYRAAFRGMIVALLTRAREMRQASRRSSACLVRGNRSEPVRCAERRESHAATRPGAHPARTQGLVPTDCYVERASPVCHAERPRSRAARWGMVPSRASLPSCRARGASAPQSPRDDVGALTEPLACLPSAELTEPTCTCRASSS